ncbi:Cyclase [Hyphomicrobiales bacterium]|nr:Cyclase [Hyphomicrobiales bacterium]CAH1693615.1 Cyclase [Hyphomicrobiales bacterium]
MKRWKNRPEGSNWGDFGEDDQRGRLNLITAEKVRQGAAEVREGRTFCLSLPLDYPGGNALAPHRQPPRIQPTQRQDRRFFNYSFANEGPYCDCGSDDAVLIYTQYSTQWDSLAHIGQHFDADGDGVAEAVYYNGFRAGEDVVDPDARDTGRTSALGVDAMAAACVQGRGVLVDLRRHFGDQRILVGYDTLMRVLDIDGVTVETGDMLCLHTGLAALVLAMNRQPDPGVLHNACAALDGSDQRLLRWITDSGIAALVADNYAVEALPKRVCDDGVRPFVPLHNHCLFKLGLPLGELWYLSELAAWLAANGRSRFLLTAPPLRLPGAVGSPVTPIATV